MPKLKMNKYRSLQPEPYTNSSSSMKRLPSGMSKVDEKQSLKSTVGRSPSQARLLKPSNNISTKSNSSKYKINIRLCKKECNSGANINSVI